MHFKNPEILYFLLLLLVPILVHLFQLRRFKKSYFTNVRFLKQHAIQSRKSSKIKKWLLLGTRLLLLLFLILAFAQPYYEAKDQKNAANKMYIIIDNSFSMQAKGKKGELLKRAVQELLENTPENLNFSLITNSESFWNTDIKSIQNELQNLKYSAESFQLDHTITKIQAQQTTPHKDIIVITDAVGLTQKQLENSILDASTYFIIQEAEQKNNVAIDSVFISKTLDNFYEIGINLLAYGENFQPVSVSLYNNENLSAKTIVTFDSSKKTITFTVPKEAFHGYVSIEDNSLSYDNRLFFSISKTKKTNVISIGNQEKSNFLSRIYTSNEFNYINFPIENLNYSLLENQDLILLNELDEIPQALQSTLKLFVKKGGNLAIIPSEKTNIGALNSFLENFGKVQFKNTESTEKLITKINFDHPLFSGVFENRTSNFQYPKTKNSFAISSAYPVVLSYSDQSAFLTSIRKPTASVSIFSAALNSQNSNFQQSPLIVPVFYQLAQSTNKSALNALKIGANQPYYVTSKLNKDVILEVKGKEGQFIPVQQILNNKVQLSFTDFPEKAGNYSIFDAKQWIENVSFNYPRTESDLHQLNAKLLSKYKTAERISTVFNTIQTDRTDNQIWKWFVIFALLFLFAEIAIIRLVK